MDWDFKQQQSIYLGSADAEGLRSSSNVDMANRPAFVLSESFANDPPQIGSIAAAQ